LITKQRFIDYIPLTIEHELCQALANNLQQTLFDTLFAQHALSEERKLELVSEDPRTASSRARLEERRRRLMEIKQKLDGSPMQVRIRTQGVARNLNADQ